MTPLPKRKHTRSRSNKRKNSATNIFKMPNLVKCRSCGKYKKSHQACPSCGLHKSTK